MIKHYFHLLIILTLSWLLYGLCQEDLILASVTIGAALIGFLARRKTGTNAFAFFGRLPLAVILTFSLIAGILWRIVTPAPEAASAIYLGVFSVWQSAAVIASLFLWLRPYSMKNIVWLTAASWVIAALSTNVPFDETELLVFRLFCVLSFANILIHTLKKPADPRRNALHYRQLLAFGLISVIITGIFFRNIVWGLRVFDEAFMSLVGDYLLPRQYTHFLNISPYLQLTNPGSSAVDKRPVLEIASHGYPNVYLRMQAFDRYVNGTWSEAGELKRAPIPRTLTPGLLHSQMLIYRGIEDIIPSLYGTSAVAGHDTFFQDANHIVTAKEKQRLRIVTLASNPDYLPVDKDALDIQELTAVPQLLESVLAAINAEAIDPQGTPYEKARALEAYLRKNFRYTLNVNFHANDEGILEMLRERKPAYCSYFATALTLLARQEGIPARVVTGFMSQQRIGSRGERILVRVRNAHAWSEALLELKQEGSGKTYWAWVPFDGTPPTGVEEAISSVSRLDLLADRIWLFSLRTIAFIQNVDKNKLKIYTLLTLIGILLAINVKRMLPWLLARTHRRQKSKNALAARHKKTQELYSRYEQWLRRRFNESRREEETDTQLLQRLKERGLAKETLYQIHDFVDAYRDVRFGEKTDTGLEKKFKVLKKEI